jgi:hypothetical protein
LTALDSLSDEFPLSDWDSGPQKVAIVPAALGLVSSQREIARVAVEPTGVVRPEAIAAARPGVVLRFRHDSCSDRIELDVTAAGQEVLVPRDEARLVATFPQGSAPAFEAVVLTCLPPAKTLHELAEAGGFAGREQQVDVVRHQAESVDGDPVLVLVFKQGVEIALVILPLREDHIPVMTSLNDVVRIVRQDDPCHSRHGALSSASLLSRNISLRK